MISGTSPYQYQIYGLRVASNMALPAARECSPESHAIDVTIEEGAVAPTLPGSSFQAHWIEVKDKACLLRFEGIGRFLVRDGRSIVVDKDPQASAEDVRTFIYGASLGAIVHQRGMVPLHVSALDAPAGAIAFTGASEAGKSTTAAFLNQDLGWPLLCDDVGVLAKVGAGVSLDSGLTTVKLWQAALDAMKLSNAGLQRDLTRSDKFHAIAADRFGARRPPLRHLIVLDWGAETSLEPIRGREAYMSVLGAVYRPEYAELFANRSIIASEALALTQVVRVWRLTRMRDLAALSRVSRLVAALNEGA